ncbi:LytR/AlgR family response regulator transcription factor [Gemmatimonas sp.]|jgi:two-component system LytT family response regulator|uniref:LytR/AlgR family response regulator transcription factor n=1 Tax=Gemmatimonas sp. TaxID=1962908 RepID=UPI0037C045A8
MTKPPSSSVVRVMIVDDESLARQRLKRLLAQDSRVQVVGEAADVPTARLQLPVLKPTLLFLDVSMPGEDGFSLLQDLPPELRPFVVFVTAHADAAVRAFDARATDFLVKPVRIERLTESVDRAVDALESRATSQPLFDDEIRAELARLVRDVAGHRDTATSPVHFAVTVGRRTRFVKVDDVDWFEADGNYVRLHVGRETHLVRTTMQKLAQSLDSLRFARIHRSYIVPVDRVRELVQLGTGEYELRLTTEATLPVMRTYRDRLPLG